MKVFFVVVMMIIGTINHAQEITMNTAQLRIYNKVDNYLADYGWREFDTKIIHDVKAKVWIIESQGQVYRYEYTKYKANNNSSATFFCYNDFVIEYELNGKYVVLSYTEIQNSKPVKVYLTYFNFNYNRK